MTGTTRSKMSGRGTVMLVKNRSTRLVWFIIMDRRSTNNNIRMAAEPAIHRAVRLKTGIFLSFSFCRLLMMARKGQIKTDRNRARQMVFTTSVKRVVA